MRCASISVGVVDYVDPRYRNSDMKLRYSSDDAAAFNRYASTAWVDKADIHLPFPDRQATAAAVDGAFWHISSGGHFDLLLVYLSGHGELGQGGLGWFCLADASPGLPSLDATALDRLLGSVNADRVILFIDCCYAEAVTAGMRFFTALDGHLTRIFVTSARSSQRSWEDEALKRSIFSDILLRALSSASDVADASGRVDLEARLLPRLREQVPLNTAARKQGNIQEPVAGGLSVAATKLPIVTSKSLGRELSIAETVRGRVRSLVGGAAIATAVGLIAIDGMAFHLSTAGTGEILVRPGLRATHDLMPAHLRPDVDTGLRIPDIVQTRDAFLADLSDGSIRGVHSHLDERGLRPWFSSVGDALMAGTRSSVAALAAGQLLAVEPDDTPPPLIEALFLTRETGRPILDIAREIYPLDRKLDAECAQPAARRLDFTVLSSGRNVFEVDVAWLASTASQSASERSARLAEMVHLTAYRASHTDDRETRASEFRAFAAAVHRLISQASDPDGLMGHGTTRLLPLRHGWCATHAMFALAVLPGQEVHRREAEAEFIRVLRTTYDVSPGDLPSAAQDLAGLALAEVGSIVPLGDETLAALEELARRDDLDFSQLEPALQIVRAVAASQRLPRTLTDALIARMSGPAVENDFAPLCAFAVLAANAPFLRQEQVARVATWADERAQAERTMSQFHRGLGYLATARRGIAPAHREILVASLSPTSRFTPRAVNYRGETVITASGDEALVALGRVAQVSDLPAAVAQRLANSAMGRPRLDGRDEIVKGLAAQWYRKVPEVITPQTIVDRLRRERSDSARRSLEAELAAMRVVQLSMNEREKTLAALISRWREETEPEIRVDIARVIGRTQIIW